ncbi:MAG: hypothetical protein JXA54_06880 [Candidatus Heimdallarchaeota archaeon]|nr:hypothetical protein [Candidatus Heimdallarchaeota archaeon]
MNQKMDNQKLVGLICAVIATIFSFIAAMMVLFADFGGMYVGPPSYYAYFCLFCSYLGGWSKIFIILLGLIFLAVLAISIMILLSYFGKVSAGLVKQLQLFGLIGSIAAFAFTFILLIIFAIQAGPYAWEWWVSTGFYGGLIGSIIVGASLGVHLFLSKKSSQ